MPDMQHQNLHPNEVDFNFPFGQKNDCQTIVSNIQKLQVATINETADLLDTAMLELAVNRIENAQNIVLFANSPNRYLGELSARKLCSIGKLARVAVSGETGLLASALGEGDCAIMISYSGNNPAHEPLDKVEILQANHVTMTDITSGGNNNLREKVDCVFTMASRERLYTKISNFSTEESIGYILNCIFSCVFARQYQKNRNYKYITPDCWRGNDIPE